MVDNYLLKGYLFEDRFVRVAYIHNIIELDPVDGWRKYALGNRTTFLINDIHVSKEEAELVMDAIKSESGELTTADFYPERVEEILRRVQAESSSALTSSPKCSIIQVRSPRLA